MPNIKTQERLDWKEANPREAHQEFELADYVFRLSSALHTKIEDEDKDVEEINPNNKSPLNDVSSSQWAEAERQMLSLEAYVKEHRIHADRVKSTKIDAFLKQVLKAFKQFDEAGIDRVKVDVAMVERIWGLADKVGSGLVYLVTVDRRRAKNETAPPHTTRSIFLLKSAPPADFKFTKSKDEWRTKQLVEIKSFFDDYILVDDLKVDNERAWGNAFNELSRLEDMLVGGFSPENIRDSGIAQTLKDVSSKIRALEEQRAGNEKGDLSLMYVSWELTMRVSAYFDEVLK